jgi:N utilization substance protein A
VIEVRIDEEHRIANVVVPERMLSLAIGREGQNARLAAKLTGWRIDIRSDVSVAEAARAEAEAKPAEAIAEPEVNDEPAPIAPIAPIAEPEVTAAPELATVEAIPEAAVAATEPGADDQAAPAKPKRKKPVAKPKAGSEVVVAPPSASEEVSS